MELHNQNKTCIKRFGQISLGLLESIICLPRPRSLMHTFLILPISPRLGLADEARRLGGGGVGGNGDLVGVLDGGGGPRGVT